MDKLTIEQQLQKPFPPEDIEWRAQSSGIKNDNAWAMIMPYVTNRANQERLDEVFGVFGWENEFREVMQKDKISFLCGITIYEQKLPSRDGFRESVTKWDGADETNFENFKGGLSGSMKRASVQLGIGRYLYKLDTYFAQLRTDKKGMDFSVNIKKDKSDKFGTRYYFNAPQLPAFALPDKYEYKIQQESKKDKHEEVIEKELGGKTFTQQCEEIKTLDDLKQWYVEQLLLGLSVEDKEAMTACKDNRKEEILVEAGKRKKPETTENIATNKYSFEELKAMKIPELHKVCKDYDLMGWSKKSKSDVINLILKHIN